MNKTLIFLLVIMAFIPIAFAEETIEKVLCGPGTILEDGKCAPNYSSGTIHSVGDEGMLPFVPVVILIFSGICVAAYLIKRREEN